MHSTLFTPGELIVMASMLAFAFASALAFAYKEDRERRQRLQAVYDRHGIKKKAR